MPQQTSRNTAAHYKGFKCKEAVAIYSDTREKKLLWNKIDFSSRGKIWTITVKAGKLLICSFFSYHTKKISLQ